MSRYYLIILFFCIFENIYSQFSDAPYMKDGVTYKANRLINNTPDFATININQYSLGNGVQVYKDQDKDLYLDGKFYIQLYNNGHSIAIFNKGLLNGDYEEYRGANIFRKSFYKNGLLEGDQFTFNSDGSKLSAMKYKNGVILSRADYHQNGQLAQIESYNNLGTRNGLIVAYDETGKVRKEINYVDGAIQGESVEHNSDGTTEIINYVDSRPEGGYKLLYSNGNTKTEGQYDSNGDIIGKWLEYYENGNLKSEFNYSDMRLNGDATEYYENGKLKYSAFYKDGKKEGAYKEYSESPYQLIEESNYKNNNLDGVYKAYNDGNIWRDCLYKDGKLVSEKQYLNGKISVLKMLDQYGNLVDVKKYDSVGKSTYQNKTYKKSPTLRSVEDDYGIIDIE